MIEIIPDAIMNILYNAPAMLCAGGNSWSNGWTGLTREKYNLVTDNVGNVIANAPVPQKNLINLFDRPYNIESDQARPAVYLGVSDNELTDEEDFAVMSGGPARRVEYRVMTIPLYICAAAPDFYSARRQRSQLVNNIKTILAPAVTGPYWWQLTISSKGSSGGRTVVTVSSPNGGTQTVTEATANMSVRVAYKYIYSQGVA